MGRFKEAEDLLRKALTDVEAWKQDPNFRNNTYSRHIELTCHRSLVKLLMATGRPQEAEQELRRTLVLAEGLATDNPGSPGSQDDWADALYQWGERLKDTGRSGEAEESYRRALAIEEDLAAKHPNESRYRNFIAWFLATCPAPQLRDPPRAVELARRAAEGAPDRAEIYNTLGVAHYRAGNWRSAIEALERSEAISRDNLGFDGFFLAMAHCQLGDRVQARRWYDQSDAWMRKYQPANNELVRFRAEAAALLGLADLPADVFVGP
jgi:tetratricopeptide (TPR) repeat protein